MLDITSAGFGAHARGDLGEPQLVGQCGLTRYPRIVPHGATEPREQLDGRLPGVRVLLRDGRRPASLVLVTKMSGRC